MRIECDQTQNSVVCHVVGDLEHLAVPRFQKGVAPLGEKEQVIFELSGVPHVDSVGLRWGSAPSYMRSGVLGKQAARRLSVVPARP
jgi:hypothetical protein